MAHREQLYVNIFYLGSCYILLALNRLSACQYLKMQSVYYVLQCFVYRPRRIHNIIAMIYFWNYCDDKTSFYLVIGVPWLHFIVGLLSFVKERNSSVRFGLSIVSLLGCYLAAHMISILLWWRQLTLIEFGFNV